MSDSFPHSAMSRFPTFSRQTSSQGFASPVISSPGPVTGLVTGRQNLQSPPPAAPPSPALQASQSFGHKPPPYSPWLTARHSPGAFALQGLIDQSVLSVFPPSVVPIQRGRQSTRACHQTAPLVTVQATLPVSLHGPRRPAFRCSRSVALCQ